MIKTKIINYRLTQLKKLSDYISNPKTDKGRLYYTFASDDSIEFYKILNEITELRESKEINDIKFIELRKELINELMFLSNNLSELCSEAYPNGR